MHVVLFEPEIPPNTGSVARLCAATLTPLHLIEPLGFKIDDKHLKRAGLDYWEFVDLRVHSSWDDFVASARPHNVYGFFPSARSNRIPPPSTAATIFSSSVRRPAACRSNCSTLNAECCAAHSDDGNGRAQS